MTERRATDIGTRATVAVVVALRSVGTGILNVATGGLGGEFARLIPAGVRRVGLATSLVLLPVTAVQGLVQSALGDDRDAATEGER